MLKDLLEILPIVLNIFIFITGMLLAKTFGTVTVIVLTAPFLFLLILSFILYPDPEMPWTMFLNSVLFPKTNKD